MNCDDAVAEAAVEEKEALSASGESNPQPPMPLLPMPPALKPPLPPRVLVSADAASPSAVP
jgi:hypothetical protein